MLSGFPVTLTLLCSTMTFNLNNYFIHYHILDFPPQVVLLATLASVRLIDGFRPATRRQYARMWPDFS